MAMDTHFDEFSDTIAGFEFDDGTVLPGFGPSQNLADEFNLEDGTSNLKFMYFPLLPQDPNHFNFPPSSTASSEIESPDDLSDGILKYINQILMEENMEEKPSAIAFKRKNFGATSGKRVHCSVQPPPPAWLGTAVVEPGRRAWDGPKPISIVGSTGSIGTQTLDMVAENPDKFRVVALAAGSNVTLLVDQVKRFKPQLVAVRNESLVDELKEALSDVEDKPEIIPGEQGVIEMRSQ